MGTAPAREIVEALLTWYRSQARDLPWRAEVTPYRVLLSELMLQQTRVETVVPYFERFAARWPDEHALAAADEADVLREWAGLGYYSRARNLLRCARAAVEGGGLPETVEGLRALPGVGPYTAGAVASIAFGQRASLVDGNVERVISRIDARAEDPRSATGRRALWSRCDELQAALADGERPGDLNQALMELGATVCLPKAPQCETCPVRRSCLARAEGGAERYPTMKARGAPRPMWAAHGIARVGGRLVLGRRPRGLLGGLWEPVGIEHGERDDPARVLERALADRAGLTVVGATELGTVRHVFSHRRLVARVFAVEVTGEPRIGEWYTDLRAIDDPGEVALSTLARKLLAVSGGRG